MGDEGQFSTSEFLFIKTKGKNDNVLVRVVYKSANATFGNDLELQNFFVNTSIP